MEEHLFKEQSDDFPEQKPFSGLSHQSSRSTLNSTSDSLAEDLDPEEVELSNVNVVVRSTLNSTSDSLAEDLDPEEVELSNVNVVVRIRPLSDLEKKRGDVSCLTSQAPSTLVIESTSKTKTFTYNAIFEESSMQQDILDKCGIKRMIDMTVEGYACTVFAYGQTGSGKTHTITGPTGNNGNMLPREEDMGLMQRSFTYLFEAMDRKSSATFTLYASYLEIYNEQVKDLLNPSSRESLSVRWSKDRGFYVENLFYVECETSDDLVAVLEEGMRQKQMGTTNINEHSSRSHTIMTLLVDSEVADQEEEGLYLTKRGKVSFVDLAGSEKVKEIGSSSELISETTNINKSLLTLGNCISSLSDPKKRAGHIPYRDSKLTKLLADSLGGSGITLMIACISPSQYCFAESLSTLRYATRARRIKNKPVVRMDPREKLILSLKRELKLIRAENQYLRHLLEIPQGEEGGQTRPPAQRTPGLDENKNIQTTPHPPSRKETLESLGKSTADNSIYEMIREYMVENETLRKENVGLQSSKEESRREQEQLSKENERLIRKLTQLERVISASPISIPNLSRTTSGHSTGTLSPYKVGPPGEPLSPYTQSPSWRSQQAHSPHSPWTVEYFNNQNRMVAADRLPADQMVSGQWPQLSPSQLPPVDSVKGIPDGYRRVQREGHPTSQSFPAYGQNPLSYQRNFDAGHGMNKNRPWNSQGFPDTTSSPLHPHTDIYIPPITKTLVEQPPSNTSPPKNVPRHQSVRESEGETRMQNVGRGAAVSKKTSRYGQPSQPALGGYAVRGKYSQGLMKKNSEVKRIPEQEYDHLSSIPQTPSTTPPVVKYVPSSAAAMIAASSSDQAKGAPQSNSMKEINHKLREELQVLDGEIEYMKYMNKSAENKSHGRMAGKKR